MKSLLFETTVESPWDRLDQCAAEEFELFTRSQYKSRVLGASVNGRPAKASKKIANGDIVIMEYLPEQLFSLEPQDIPLDLLYEDEDCLVVNKARGMVVHPGAGNPDGTLVNAFLHRCGGGPGVDFRPGIVHRLDKDTSGVIILAKSSEALEFLSKQFRQRTTEKRYLAILDGILSRRGEVGGRIRRSTGDRKRFIWDAHRGKDAFTSYNLLAKGAVAARAGAGKRQLSMVEFFPRTGRTHQLRVHAVKLGAPIYGDPIYNKRSGGSQLMLHAYSLTIRVPSLNEARHFTAELPRDMRDFMSDAGLSAQGI